MRKLFILALFCLINTAVFAATWYSVTSGGDPTVLTNWNSISGGGGSNPANFTTAGDVFIMQVPMTGVTSSTWTLGPNTTLQVNGVTFTNGCANIYVGNLQVLGTGGIVGTTGNYFYISGDLTITGSAIMTNPPSYNYVHFTNTASTLASPQHLNINSTGSSTYTYSYVDAGVTVALTSNMLWTNSYAMAVTGTIDFGPYTQSGTLPFTLNSGATMYTGVPTGINGTLLASGAKTLNVAANYGFDGTSAQVTGALLPSSLTSPAQLIINNSAGVTLSQNTSNTSTTNAINFISGTLSTGGYALTIPGNSTAVAGAGAGNYVIGNLIKTITGFTSVNYEVGDATYAPMLLNFSAAGTAGSLGVLCSAGLHPSATTSGFGLSAMVNHYWTISNQAAAGPTSVTPAVTYNAGDILGGSNTQFKTQQFAGGSWLSSPTNNINTSSPYTSTPTSATLLNSLAGDYIFGAVVPYVYAVPTTVSFGLQAIGSSTVSSSILAGGNLTAGPITITAPAYFQVSTSAGGPWTSSITLSYTPPSLSPTPFYIQFNPTAATTYSDVVAVTGGGIAATYNIAVNGNALPGCSGTPTAGSATSFPTSGTGGTSFNLSLTGVSAVAGLTYQWQSSPDNSTWTNVFGATNSTYIFMGLASSTYFRCVVSCGASSASSSSQLLTLTGVAASSCIPSSYSSPCTYYAGTAGNPVIISGVAGGISDASTCGSGTGGSAYYYNNVGMSVTFVQSGSYATTMGPSYYYVSGQIWIDFNDNGVFEQSETVGGYQNPTSTTIARYHPTIVIPANAQPGIHRMRVINGYSSYYAAGYSTTYPAYPKMNPCPSSVVPYVYYADTRDYTAVVNLAPASLISTQSSIAFGNVTTGVSSIPPRFFTITGSNLAGTPITVTPPANFSVSLDGVTWYTGAMSVPFTPGFPVGSLSATNVYVNFNPSAATTYSGNIVISGASLPSAVNVAVSGTGIANCSGTPVAGTTSVTPTSGNGGVVFSLSLTGASTSGGILYQWQSSPDGTTWSNIQDGIYSTYTFSGLLANTYYRCILNCVAGSSAISTSVMVTYTGGVAASSCTPSSYYSPCTYYVGTTGNPVIINGAGGTVISDASPCGSGTGGSPYYYNNTSMSVNLNQGGSYTTTIGSAYYYMSGQIWIDFNDNGIFESSETVGGYQNPTSVTQPRYHPVITIPANATAGAHRMRVENGYTVYYAAGYSTYYPSFPSMNPCPSAVTPYQYYFDTRDYTAIVGTTACAGTPNPGIISVAGTTASCSSFTTNLINVGESATAGMSYQWQSSTSPFGGFTPISGATNSVYSPTLSSPVTLYCRQVATCANSGLSATSLPSQPISYNPTPTAITGNLAVCSTTTSALASTPTGGTWTSDNTTVATIGASSGIVTGGTPGSANITYTLSTGCYISTPITVLAQPGAISGPSSVCPAFTISLSDAGGGTWSSSNTSLATVGVSSGIVTGVTGGNPTITYTLPSGCTAVKPLTVNAITPITGTIGVCSGYGTTLYNATPGGTWSSSNTAVATIDPVTGIVNTYSGGFSTMTYLFPNGCIATAVLGVTNTPVTYTVSGGGYICSGGNAHIYLNGSGVSVGYQILRNGTPIGSPVVGTGAAPFDLGPQTLAGIYTVVANYGTPCAVTMNMGVTITINPLPTVYTVTGGGGFCAGGAGVHAYLNASNTGISYQLMSGVTPVGAAVSGTSGVLDFGSITTPGTYTVVATNTFTGCINNMSGSAVVTINPFPAAYTVTGGGSYCAAGVGVPVGLSNSVSGISYQLYIGITPVGAAVAGNGSPISFGNQLLAGTYTVVATNTTTGCVNNMSGSAVVNIIALPSLYTVMGGGAFCTGGTGVHITLSGSGVGVNYQLYKGVATVGTALAGTGSSLDFGSITVAGIYTVIASVPASACSLTMPGSATVIINPGPSTFNVTGGGSYCSGSGGLHVGLSGSNTGTNYYLFNGTSLIGGASGTGVLIDFGLKVAPGTYTVSASISGTGCAGTMAGSAVITINPLPNAYAVSGGGSYCTGAAAPHVLLSTSDLGINYQLYYNGTPVGSAIVGGAAIDFGAQTAPGIYTVLAIDPIYGCKNFMTGSAIVSINPLPSGYSVSGGGNYCTGGSGVHVSLSNSDAGVSYQLQLSSVNVGSPVSGTGSLLDFGLKTATGVYTVVATNATTTCTSNMPGSATVGLLSLPNDYSLTGGGGLCPGGAGNHIGLIGSDAGITYQLYNGTVAVGPSISGSGSAIDFGLITAPGTYTAKATNISTGCVATMSGTGLISIYALPVANTVTGGGNYCVGGTGVHIGLNGSVTGVNYQIYNGGSPIGGVVPGTGSPIDFGLFTTTGSYNIVATDITTTCTRNMTGSATVGINPLPVTHNVTGGGSYYCAGGTGVPVGLDGSNAGTNYQLYRGGVISGAALPGTGLALDFGLQTVAGSYTVIATTPATGCTNNMLSGASVIVTGLPAMHTVTGGGNYCPGTGGVVVGLNGSNAGDNYQLYLNGTATGSPLSGSGFALTFGLQTGVGNYTVVASDPITGCSTAMTGSTSVAVSSLPLVYNITGGGSYCIGGAGSHIYLSGSTSGVSYALYQGGVLTSTVIAGTGSPLDFGLQPAGTYIIKGTSTSTGCVNTMTGSVAITTNSLPVQYTVGGGGNYCVGGAGADVTLGGSESGVYYQVSLSGSVLGAPVYGTGSPINLGLQTTPGFYSVIATNSTTGCTNTMTGTSTVGNYPAVVPFTVTGGGSYCTSGTGVHVILNGSTSGVSYQLYRNGAIASVPMYGTGLALDFGLQTATGNYTVIGTDIVTSCSKTMTGSPTVSTLPLPSVFNVTGGGAICAVGSGAHVYLNGSSSGVNYQLYNSGILSGSAFAGTGSAIDFGLQTIAGTYTVKATDNTTGCSIDMTGTAPIVTGLVPVAYTVTGSSSTGYCSGGTGVALYLSNSDAGVNYQLYRGTTAVGAPVSGISGALTFGIQTLVGVYTVAATNTSTGCTNNMAGSVSVTINPKPTAYNVTGGGGICVGGSAHLGLSGSATGVTYQVYHSGIAIGSTVSGTGYALDLGAQSLTGNYTVIAMNSSTGCTNNMTGSATIYNYPAPTAFTVTGGGSFCAGSAGAHVGLNGSVTGFSYQLYRGAYLVGSPLAGTGYSIDFGVQTVTGLYTVVASNNATGCTGIMTGGVNVTAIPLPVVQSVSGGGSYCAGDAGVHIGLTGSGTGVNYQLYRGSTPVGGHIAGTGLAIDFGYQTAAGSYTVIATDATSSCTSNMSGSAAVSINSLPDVFPVNGGGSYCNGTGGVHVGLSGSGTGINYTLYYGSTSGSTLAGTGAILDFGNQTLAGSYTVKATNPATGCTSTMSGTATVINVPVVVPTVNIATAGGDTVCSGNLTSFTASVSNGGSAPAYQWAVNGVTTGTSLSYSYIPANGDIVSLVLTSNATCATPAMVNTSAAITVWAKQNPGVTISANPGVEVCQGTSVTFGATPSYGGTAPVYSWMKGGLVVGSGPTYIYVPSSGDVITCKMNSNYTCRLSNYVTSAPSNMIVDVATAPVVGIVAYPGLDIASGESLTLEATVTNGGPSPAYQWSVNGVDAPGATMPSFTGNTFHNGDVVSCSVTSSGGCAGLKGVNSVILNVSNVGVKPVVSSQDDVKVLPNPNNGVFTISGRIGTAGEEATLEITNILGQVVYKNKITASNGLIQENVQLGRSVANGMYILNVRTLNDNKVFHLVVEQ